MPEILELITVAPDQFRGQPMARRKVSRGRWEQAAAHAASGALTLLSLWASRDEVHMALLDEQTMRLNVLSLDSSANTFPSVAARHPPALRLERVITDLFGVVPGGATDTRPWLDHGRWGGTHPLGNAPATTGAGAAPYQFLPAEGESLHQIAVGPVHAGTIEPGHFRFTSQGEIVVRLEERFGYAHKGLDALMQGATIARGATLAARCSGDSTVAYGWAYAQAVEAALGAAVPERAIWLRALMAELERLANHLGDIGAICNDAAFAMMLAQCSVLRENVLRACDACFGQRAMRDCIVPGGVTGDLDSSGRHALRDLVAATERAFAPVVALYDGTASLLDRTVGTGILSRDLAQSFAAGGYVGRASGRDFDTRRDLGYAPYDTLKFEVVTRTEGDVNARIWVRIDEVGQSLSLIAQILDQLPAGPVHCPPEPVGEPREGLGLVEGFRGDILIWVALAGNARIERCHMRDPSWFQWPLIEAAIEGNIIADFPLCNKSFNCSYSGQDL